MHDDLAIVRADQPRCAELQAAGWIVVARSFGAGLDHDRLDRDRLGTLLALDADGVRRFRTGGSAENAAILAANTALGYVRDDEWLTLAAPTA